MLLLHPIHFWYDMFSFSFVPRYFLISLLISSLSHWLFRSVLFKFLWICENFQFFFLLLICCFILLWSEKILDMISIFLNILSLAFCPNIWSVLETVPYEFEKNVYSGSVTWNVLYRSVQSIKSNVPFWFFVWMFFPI